MGVFFVPITTRRHLRFFKAFSIFIRITLFHPEKK
jgi:hypothetical protein